ncbi:response regulator [Prosthecomicrobium pneumaticum]|uniref:CheY-like chemotaxis protein n=1 Tax=Prosthecomicrobium pneumaticum TaxID=81895 RepID=A0A7W9FKP3_9HYPH|nr:response regulator [Prosthecomicrobium pneumaticum]MBB5751004.1 CheY-like chemotaxis protein [Prosthecomicrobium pneumaticum]
MKTQSTILICDDEEELAQELGEFFLHQGWRVEVCFSGGAAIERLRAGLAPDVLITDLRIAGFDGGEVLAEAHALPPAHRPIMSIIITGHVLDSATHLDFGCDRLYVKPVDPDILLSDIRGFIAQRGEMAETAG